MNYQQLKALSRTAQLWLLSMVVAIPVQSLYSQESASLVIFNSKIMTADGNRSVSIAIRNDRIVAVGRAAEIEKYVGDQTQKIDAESHSVTPGFNDAHVHFLSGSQSLGQIELSNTQSLEEIGQRIQEFLAAHPNETCVVGRGWVYGAFPDGLPTKEQLDQWISDRPAIMRCYDGHTMWVNSAALKAAGVTTATPDPEGGVIVRDKQGEATGCIKESAQRMFDKIIPVASRQEKISALKSGIADAHRLGVTSIQDAAAELDDLELLDSLRASGELSLRTYFALQAPAHLDDAGLEKLEQLRRRFPKLRIGAVKLFVDGVVESHTAVLLSPYSNRPTKGLPELDEVELNRTIQKLDAAGWQIWVHAIGDGGIRMTLDAIEQAQLKNIDRKTPRRHRLEHIETIDAADIPRFAALGVVASMQPYHANPNTNVANVWEMNLGPDRASRAWMWKSISDAGGHLAFGSDWPVVSLDPRLGLHTAITRQTLGGQPANGFIPSQRLSLSTALEAYTTGAAYAEYQEDEKGAIVPGQLADLLIWSDDLSGLPVDKVHAADVVMTIIGGRIVFSR